VTAAWVYRQSKHTPGWWTVGFFDGEGDWNPESDHGKAECAAQRVAYLNGGGDPLVQSEACVERANTAIRQLVEAPTQEEAQALWDRLDLEVRAMLRRAVHCVKGDRDATSNP
jgi:hypothetical protein